MVSPKSPTAVICTDSISPLLLHKPQLQKVAFEQQLTPARAQPQAQLHKQEPLTALTQPQVS